MDSLVSSIYIAMIYIIFTTLSLLILRKILIKFKFLDFPNHRSNHNNPVPLGAGIVVVPILSFTPLLLGYEWQPEILFAIILFFSISLLDDFKKIPAIIRLGFHFATITFIILTYDNIGKLLNEFYSDFPVVILYIFLILFLIWFVNLFNFMDGIDGITGIETIIIGLGVSIIHYNIDGTYNMYSISLIGVAIGFLIHNLSSKRIFLGDCGSIPLGFICGIILVDLIFKGYWVSAIILPAYYLSDSSITLFTRLLKRKKVWQAHNEHYYQKAVRRGLSHKKVSFLVALHGAGLIFLSIMAFFDKNAIYLLILTFLWCIAFLFYLALPWKNQFDKTN